MKTEGDAFMVSFQEAARAVEWCMTVQQQLLLVDWPQEIYSHAKSKREVSESTGTRRGVFLWISLFKSLQKGLCCITVCEFEWEFILAILPLNAIQSLRFVLCSSKKIQ